ncbi:MAG: PEP-CTERM sorting domain-containing protein [Fimbriimonadaceae bacterium]|nr:PEP-CTERM sorting domain-containing protein [Fimbriimonadaceae bacterium]
MLKRMRFTIACSGLLALSMSAHATWYTNEADFLAAVGPNLYLEDFNGWTNASPLNGAPSWASPGANGFGWTASADQGLYSLPGAISTSSPFKIINFNFTGLPVTAFGLVLGNSDQNGNDFAGDSTLRLSNGESKALTQGATRSFVGWVGASSFASAEIFSSHWVVGDHIYTSGPVPEPATLAVLTIGAIALRRRNTKKA